MATRGCATGTGPGVLGEKQGRGEEMGEKCCGSEPLVVASKVKAYIKGKGFMTGSDAIDAINERVCCILDAAMKRTKANKRSTVKAQDV